MEVIPRSSFLQFNADTFECIRKKYSFDKPNKLRNAYDSLAMWIQNQKHFTKKDYQKNMFYKAYKFCEDLIENFEAKEYLERILINNDGNIEGAKKMIDNMCTFKTVLPKYYEAFDMEDSYIMKIIHCSLLLKMTENHNRVFMLKNFGQHYKPGIFVFYQFAIMLCEYYNAVDYSNGIIAIFDYKENNIRELAKAINLVELQQFIAILMEGYGIQSRIKGIHYLTSSKIIEVFISLIKQALSPKVAECIHVHKDVETLYGYVPKEIMPVDYGGNLKPLKELNDDFRNDLNSFEFKKYFNKMKGACTNEILRNESKLKERFIEVTGSFRQLNID